MTLGTNVTITCDKPNHQLEFYFDYTLECNKKLPGCYEVCIVTPPNQNQVILGKKIGETIRANEPIVILCSDKSTTIATCGFDTVVTYPSCGVMAEPTIPVYVWVIIAVTIGAVVVAIAIIVGVKVVQGRKYVDEAEDTTTSKSIAMATNIESGKKRQVLSKPFDTQTFLLHMQVSPL